MTRYGALPMAGPKFCKAGKTRYHPNRVGGCLGKAVLNGFDFSQRVLANRFAGGLQNLGGARCGHWAISACHAGSGMGRAFAFLPGSNRGNRGYGKEQHRYEKRCNAKADVMKRTHEGRKGTGNPFKKSF